MAPTSHLLCFGLQLPLVIFRLTGDPFVLVSVPVQSSKRKDDGPVRSSQTSTTSTNKHHGRQKSTRQIVSISKSPQACTVQLTSHDKISKRKKKKKIFKKYTMYCTYVQAKYKLTTNQFVQHQTHKTTLLTKGGLDNPENYSSFLLKQRGTMEKKEHILAFICLDPANRWISFFFLCEF